MSLHTIAYLCLIVTGMFTLQSYVADANTINKPHASIHERASSMVEIDSLDLVIFDLDRYTVEGNIVSIPVFIESDDVINALDFSMKIDTHHLDFESIVDHTGDLMYTAYLNPSDLKLRFTSNSFSPYPKGLERVVSIRFVVRNGIVSRSDFESLLAYLNGEKCSTDLQGKDISLSSKDIPEPAIFISPNPVSDIIIVSADHEGTFELFDVQGRAVLLRHALKNGVTSTIDVGHLARGTYTACIVSKTHRPKTQMIVLQ